MKVLIIFNREPYDNTDVTWNGLSLAGKLVEAAQEFRKIDPQAMRVLLDYACAWPGNIRELHNVVEYAFAVGRGTTLRLSELPPEIREPRGVNQIRQTVPLLAEEETAAIRQALEQSKGMVTTAAQLLGMSRATFWRKRRLYGV